MTMRYRVVVADDDDDMRTLLRHTLERSQRFVVVGEAADGRSAVRETEALLPDLVLLDVAMPEIDGVRALPLLRAAAPDAAVVVISGLDPQRMWPALEAGGAAAFVPKGLTASRLIEELLGVLDREHVRPPVTGEEVHLEATVHLDAQPISAREARSFVRRTLGDWECESMVDVVLLLTSELVTNAILHAGSEVDLNLRLAGGVLRITVSDASERPPVLRDASPESTGGRGVALLDAMAVDWGAVPTASGKLVWFEVAIS